MQLKQVKIMALEYRVVHLLTILGAAALLFTGVGSFPGSPKTVPHEALGFSSIVILGGYGVYLVRKRQVRLFDGLRKPIRNQMDEAIAIIRNYTFGTSLPPVVKRGMGRHNVLSSYASVLLAASFVVLMVSGVFLTVLSPGASSSAFFVLLHLSAVIMRENKPLLRAVFTNGRVPLDWARDHMEEFLRKIA